MFLLRLSRRLVYPWRGARYVRGTIYTAPDAETYRAMLETGEFSGATSIIEARHVPPRDPAPIEIFVVRDIGLGDVLMALPAAQEFARRNPLARVSYAVGPAYAELVRAQPGFHRVVAIGETALDRSIDLRWYVERHAHARTVSRQVLFAKGLGIQISDGQIRGLRRPLVVLEEWRAAAREKLGAFCGRSPLVALSLRGSTAVRSIDYPAGADILRALLEAGVNVVLTETEAPFDHPNLLSLAGRISLVEFAAVLEACDAVVAPDTGTLHLGGHLGKPLVALFTTWPAALRLHGYDAISVSPAELLCSPCFDHGCPARWCASWPLPGDVAAAVAEVLRPRFDLAARLDPDASSTWQRFGRPSTTAAHAEAAAVHA